MRTETNEQSAKGERPGKKEKEQWTTATKKGAGAEDYGGRAVVCSTPSDVDGD